MSTTKNYPLSTIGRKLCAIILDYILIILVSIGIMYAFIFFVFDKNFRYLLPNQGTLFSGLFCLAIVTNFLWWFLYNVMLIKLSGGYTLFFWILKLKVYWKNDSQIIMRLFQHQGLGIIGYYGCLLLIGIISFAFEDPLLFIANTFSFNTLNNVGSGIKIASGTMIALLVLISLPLLGIFINEISSSGTISYLDERYDFFIVHMVPNEQVKVSKTSNSKHQLPGSIDLEELEKL